jgi:hypothetical protein
MPVNACEAEVRMLDLILSRRRVLPSEKRPRQLRERITIGGTLIEAGVKAGFVLWRDVKPGAYGLSGIGQTGLVVLSDG